MTQIWHILKNSGLIKKDSKTYQKVRQTLQQWKNSNRKIKIHEFNLLMDEVITMKRNLILKILGFE